MIGDLIESTLSGLAYQETAVPAAHLKYSGTAKTYIQYCTYLDHDESFADDEPQDGEIYETIDIYSDKRDAPMDLLPEVKSRMRAAGFSYLSAGPELHEEDSGMYHLPVDFYFEREA